MQFKEKFLEKSSCDLFYIALLKIYRQWVNFWDAS